MAKGRRAIDAPWRRGITGVSVTGPIRPERRSGAVALYVSVSVHVIFAAPGC
jgi:hypothetical protein